MARRSALDHEHRRDVAERLELEYLPAGEPAGIKAQIAPKEEEIDQLRQTVAGLREKAGRARGRRKGTKPGRTGIPAKPKYRNIEKPKPVKTGIKRNGPHASKRCNIHNDNT